jgi:YD repeat-containing protein
MKARWYVGEHASMLIMATIIAFATTIALPRSAPAAVDMTNANYSTTYADVLQSQGGLTVRRTYNSRTLYNGLFGFGWCSDFETAAKITPEGAVVITECGAGFTRVYRPTDYQARVAATVERILEAAKDTARVELAQGREPDLAGRLRQNPELRLRWSRRVGLAIPNPTMELLLPTDAGGTAVRRDSNGIDFVEGGVVTRRFDTSGRLIEEKLGVNGVRRMLRDGEGHLRAIFSEGEVLRVNLSEDGKKITGIFPPTGHPALYHYDGENLVSVVNVWGNTYDYEYDELHNLTKEIFPDKTTKTLTYDSDRDWVTSFTDRAECQETYTYKDDEIDPSLHYWSAVVKTCGKERREVNRAQYEFWRIRPQVGPDYVKRVRIETGKTGVLDTTFDDSSKQPLIIVTKDTAVRFQLTFAGLLKSWRSAVSYGLVNELDPCGKPALVTINQSGGLEVLHYEYDETCGLLRASSSTGQSLSFILNSKGELGRIEPRGSRESNQGELARILPKLIPDEIASFVERGGPGVCPLWKQYVAQLEDKPVWRHCSDPRE